MCFRIAFGQQSEISGTITRESSGEKLFGVLVMPDGKAGTVSDTNGLYKISLPAGSHHITFKLLGFETKMENIVVESSEPKKINIFLRQFAKELGVLVVSAGRFEQKLEDVTVSMNVIKPALVENTNTTNMEDIMGQIPGVNVTDGQMNIRGGSGWSYGAGSRVQVLVDDIPILSGDANDVKWNFIPVENLEQVEVIKGASSALFGSSALNGVMNIRTAYPKETPITKATLYTGVYDTPKRKELKWWGDNYQRTSGYSIFHSEQFGQNDIVAGANYFNDDGFRQGEDEQRFRINANYRHRFKKIPGLALGLKSNVMQTHMGSFFIWANDSTGALNPLGGMDTSTTTISVGNTTRLSMDPFFNYVKNNGTSHKLNTRYFVTINKNNTSQQSTARFYFGEYQFQKKFKDFLTFTLGATDSYTDVERELYGKHTGNNFAVFAQADIKYKKISFSLGGRMEKSRLDTVTDDFKPVVRTGINYHLLKETYLRASYGQGYRFPSVAEKYISTQISSVKIFPNDSLMPETGWSAELGIMQGIKIGEWKGYFDVAVFQTEYKEMVEFLFDAYYPSWIVTPQYNIDTLLKYLGFRSNNIGNTRIQGIDVSLSGSGDIGNAEIAILVGYTFMNPRQTNFDLAVDTNRNSLNTNILKYRYRHLFKGDIECTVKKVSAGISIRYNSLMENIDKLFSEGLPPLLPSMKSYRDKHDTGDTVFDFRLSYQVLTNLKTAFIVKNLFNHEYVGRPYDMQPPRSFTLQFSLSL
ncbi:MAG: TonB-dependent receptor [Bacteroidia bacterium]|nr:TonB-dependent receptor [Bacteroidia bacterium]